MLVLVNFGYPAMVSAIDALVDRRDVIVYDAESHACIVDGVRLHLGKRFASYIMICRVLKNNLNMLKKL